MLLVGLCVGCPGPAAPLDATTDAESPDALDARGSTASVEVVAQAVLDGTPTASISDACHSVDAIRVELSGFEWSSDVTERVRVDMRSEIDFFGESTAIMQLPPGRYSLVELDIERLEMNVDGTLTVETEGFTARARCSSVLELGVADERRVSVQIEGRVLLDELATRLVDDPASEAIRESFKEAIRLRCE